MAILTPDETILGLLAIRSRHGYELLDAFRRFDQLGRVWNMSTSQLYAVLKRLERDGWITGREIQSENAPPRMEYSLTAEGETKLYAWLHEKQPSASIRRIRVEFLSRLFIGNELDLPLHEMVQRQRTSCTAELESLMQERKHAQPGLDDLALEFNIGQLEAVLSWIDRCEQMITKRTIIQEDRE